MEIASRVRYLLAMTEPDGLEDLRQATANREAAAAALTEANLECVRLALDHLRGKTHGPTAVAAASPWTEARLRVIARANGIEPAKPGRKKPTPPSE